MRFFSQLFLAVLALMMVIAVGAVFRVVMRSDLTLVGKSLVLAAGLAAIGLAVTSIGWVRQTDADAGYWTIATGRKPSDEVSLRSWRWARANFLCWLVLTLGLLGFGLAAWLKIL